jgi:hypothetical protein
MPRHNRVSPVGDIILTPAHGTFMGNRGVLHNHQGELCARTRASAGSSVSFRSEADIAS